MKESQIVDYFELLEKKLFDEKNRKRIVLDLDWIKSLKDYETPGVYLFFEDDQPCYIGETGNLKKRMNDLRNTKNHTLRRNFGHKHFEGHPEFYKATSNKNFHPDIESLLITLMIERLTVSLLPIKLGRKECEEYICSKYGLLNKYNLRSKRR
ncbi:GIY-YIG nuclease family protein [Flagellimonas sp.]|uniref:GIY-YIG nuclease family protein n=1 Tax=Flagellimonas sp. TaxID=2058762 RepID=UPI003BB1C024